MKLEKELKSKINYLFDILSKNGVAELRVDFYGSGDDGNMEIGDACPSLDQINLDEPTIYDDVSLEELICNITDSILDKRGVDYANGQGNNGCVVYTVKGKQIDMEYQVIEDAEYSFSI